MGHHRARALALTAQARTYLDELDDRAGHKVRPGAALCPRCGHPATVWDGTITCPSVGHQCRGNGMAAT